jgi:hypothetical protein
LFGECFEIINKSNEWAYGISKTDNYLGWIKLSNFSNVIKSSHIINVPRTIMYCKPDIKSNIIQYLPMCAQIKIVKADNQWAQIKLHNNCNYKFGYISQKHYTYINKKEKDWVKYAEFLLGTPYHFGGRDTIGIDCSALLQLAVRSAGVFLERDTKDQIKSSLLQNSKNKDITRGSIIFWKNHVAISLNENQIIHANAFHMSTKIESFKDANKRIEKTNGEIIKIRNLIISS